MCFGEGGVGGGWGGGFGLQQMLIGAYLGGQCEDNALCMNDAGVAQIIDAATAQNLCPRSEPDWLWEVDALVLGQ